MVFVEEGGAGGRLCSIERDFLVGVFALGKMVALQNARV